MKTLFKPWWLTIGTLVILLAFSESVFYQKVDRVDNFLLGEPSCNLWLADQINHGKVLYRDVFSQYGAVPTYACALCAAIAGNTPGTFLRLTQFLSLLSAVLAWVLLRRRLSPGQTAFFLVFGLGYAFFYPGGRNTYLVMERILVIVLALLWKPAGSSSGKHDFLVGSLLGATQTVKFGCGIVAFIAWVLVDLCQGRVSWNDFLRRWILMGLGYLVVTLVWAIVLFSFIPGYVAIDVLWPAYMKANYSIYHSFESRWPHWTDKGDFLGRQMETLTAFALVLWVIAVVLWQRRRDVLTKVEEGGAFLFLGFFFLVGIGIYFKHVYHYYEYYWIVILAAAWPWKMLPRWPRLGVAALLLVGFIVQIRWMIERIPPELDRQVQIPAGYRLWATPAQAAMIGKLQEQVSQLRAQRPGHDAVYVVGLGAGMHQTFQWPAANRQSIWTMMGFTRPYDVQPMIDSLKDTAAVVVYDGHIQADDPRQWTQTYMGSDPIPIPTGLPEIFCQELARKLGPPQQIAKDLYVYPVQPEGSSR